MTDYDVLVKKLKESEKRPASAEMPKDEWKKKEIVTGAPVEKTKKTPVRVQLLENPGLPSAPFSPGGIPWSTAFWYLVLLAAALALALLVD